MPVAVRLPRDSRHSVSIRAELGLWPGRFLGGFIGLGAADGESQLKPVILLASEK